MVIRPTAPPRRWHYTTITEAERLKPAGSTGDVYPTCSFRVYGDIELASN